MITREKKARVLSGIQPTGILHLGNYLGAIAQWVEHQAEHDNLFCVVDLHTLTIPESMSAKERYQKTNEYLALYLACGIDPEISTIYIQSQVRELSELTWILNCVTPVGWLERMTQYKTKAKGLESIGCGLLDYPVLMAADILIYDTDLVPVGEDQKQHLELSCEIARRFNGLFGETFKIPKITMPKLGARVMGLDDPSQKMSKSIGEKKPGHAIGLLHSEAQIKKAIMSSVTDSGQETRYDLASPGVKNLLNIYCALTKKSPEVASREFLGQGYGHLKKAVFEAVMEAIIPIRAHFDKLIGDQTYLMKIAKIGADRASSLAQQKMLEVRKRVGVH
ncbi:MAG TPA: tryptophan--tRNA ligase [Myxococcota bacterium]|nr:tryptophan--tRNA ligase [Myxococcota bacterium]